MDHRKFRKQYKAVSTHSLLLSLAAPSLFAIAIMGCSEVQTSPSGRSESAIASDSTPALKHPISEAFGLKLGDVFTPPAGVKLEPPSALPGNVYKIKLTEPVAPFNEIEVGVTPKGGLIYLLSAEAEVENPGDSLEALARLIEEKYGRKPRWPGWRESPYSRLLDEAKRRIVVDLSPNHGVSIYYTAIDIEDAAHKEDDELAAERAGKVKEGLNPKKF